jgi:hypothetical protein
MGIDDVVLQMVSAGTLFGPTSGGVAGRPKHVGQILRGVVTLIDEGHPHPSIHHAFVQPNYWVGTLGELTDYSTQCLRGCAEDMLAGIKPDELRLWQSNMAAHRGGLVRPKNPQAAEAAICARDLADGLVCRQPPAIRLFVEAVLAQVAASGMVPDGRRADEFLAGVLAEYRGERHAGADRQLSEPAVVG